jgi:Rrf2 family protein
MLDLALHYDEGPISIRDIARRQDLSQKYLERLLVALQAGGAVRAMRGAKGGYQLSRPPEQINLREIYHVFEGTDGFVECTSKPEICQRSDLCITQEVWSEMYNAALRILEATTLADLVQRARRKQTVDLYDI